MKLFGAPAPRQTPPGYSVVGDRLVVRGDVETDGTVRVDGRIEGATHRFGTLVVGAGGAVFGDVEAREVVIAGTVEGNVRASGRIEIEPGAAVHGQIQANSMLLREGGVVDGQVSIGTPEPTVGLPAGAAPGRRLELAAAPAVASRPRGVDR